MVILFYAFGRELGPLKRRLERHWPLGLDGLRGFRARVGRLEIMAVATGIGPARAAEIARRAFKAIPEAESVIATGVAGALSPGLAVGDIVIADRLIVAAADGAHPERVLELESKRVEAIQNLLNAAGLAVSTGGVLTCTRVLATPGEKRHARQESGAIAVDMESAALASEAAAEGLPVVCVRAVMDRVNDEIAGAGLTGAAGGLQVLKAARTILGEPSLLLSLPRTIRNLTVATRALADALETVLNSAQ